jgi:hypothetical protein
VREKLPQNSMAPARGSRGAAAKNTREWERRGLGFSGGGELGEARVSPRDFYAEGGASKPSDSYPGDPAVPWRAARFEGYYAFAILEEGKRVSLEKKGEEESRLSSGPHFGRGPQRS